MTETELDSLQTELNSANGRGFYLIGIVSNQPVVFSDIRTFLDMFPDTRNWQLKQIKAFITNHLENYQPPSNPNNYKFKFLLADSK